MKKFKEKIYQFISKEIPDNSRVLDLGCGNGELLDHLITNKSVIGHGIDIKTDALVKCIEKGIPVIQLNLDNLPLDFPDKSFDFVVLNQTIQEIYKSKEMIEEILRIGKAGILGFPNFGYFKVRLSFLFKGRMPMSKQLPYKWFDTPNIHLLTIKDFKDFCKKENIKIIKQIYIKKSFFRNKYKEIKYFHNLRAELAIFKISK